MTILDTAGGIIFEKGEKIRYMECQRDDGYCTKELLKNENEKFRKGCEENGLSFSLIDENYEQTIEGILSQNYSS